MLLRMQAELIYFALSIAAGVLAALLGGGMKWLHQRKRLAIWLGFLDLLYWFLLGFSLFLLCFYRNNGIFRGYAVVGTLAGYGLFYTAIRLIKGDRGWERQKLRGSHKARKAKKVRKRWLKKSKKAEEAEMEMGVKTGGQRLWQKRTGTEKNEKERE